MQKFIECTTRPDGNAIPNWTNPLMRGCTLLSLCESINPLEYVRNYRAGSTGSLANVSTGRLGRGDSVTSNALNRTVLCPNGDRVFPNSSQATIVHVRRKTDTTTRQSVTFYNGGAAADRTLVHAPWSDGTIYFDFGNATDGSGRTFLAGQTWTTNVDYFIFVAGQTKGREIWRNGVKIKNNTTAKATRPSNTGEYGIGGNAAGTFSDIEEFYLHAVFNAEWTDRQCLEWFANPWQLFAIPAPSPLDQIVVAGSTFLPRIIFNF